MFLLHLEQHGNALEDRIEYLIPQCDERITKISLGECGRVVCRTGVNRHLSTHLPSLSKCCFTKRKQPTQYAKYSIHTVSSYSPTSYFHCTISPPTSILAKHREPRASLNFEDLQSIIIKAQVASPILRRLCTIWDATKTIPVAIDQGTTIVPLIGCMIQLMRSKTAVRMQANAGALHAHRLQAMIRAPRRRRREMVTAITTTTTPHVDTTVIVTRPPTDVAGTRRPRAAITLPAPA